MNKKINKPHPLEDETGWVKFWKTVWDGFKPDLVDSHFLEGDITSAMLTKITKLINEIVTDEDCNNFKIGVTGDPKIRIDKKDYRKDYDYMYLIFRSKKAYEISDLEVRYIQKYKILQPDKIDNISETKANNMISYDGFYYLYVVVNQI